MMLTQPSTQPAMISENDSAKLRHRLTAALFACCVFACGGGGAGSAAPSPASAPPPAPTPTPAPPPAAQPLQADIRLLFMGNSHTSFHNLPATVSGLLQAAKPSRSVTFTQSPDSMLLNERGSHAPSISLIGSQKWTHVVLQAQDYSSSGQFTYPTIGAEKLVQLATTQGSQPILFADWPRQGINETERIYATYASIARVQPACLPPVPQAFDLAAARHPSIRLWDTDGNHSAPPGAFLAAVILFSSIDDTTPTSLPALTEIAVDASTQAQLRQVATDTIRQHPAKLFCTKP